MGVRGKNRLRLQRMDVGLYPVVNDAENSHAVPHIIKNVVVSATEEMTQVDLSTMP